jgi:hypothetical protein
MAKAAAKPVKPAASKSKPTAKAKPTAQTAKAAHAAKPHHATIRMYLQGLGDCFLITIPRRSGRPYRIMIDCGVILGTKDATTTMQGVMQSILEATTDGDAGPFVDLLVATHQHWDHLSGFVQAKDLFKQLEVGQVWLAWTEDPKDALANRLRKEREGAKAALRLAGTAMNMAGDSEGAAEISGLLDFFGAAGGNSTEDALQIVKDKKTATEIRYCRPTDEPVEIADPKLRIYVLGPPQDEKLLKKTLASKKEPETYGLAQFAATADIAAALSGNDDEAPFDGLRPIPFTAAQSMEFFQRHYWGAGEDAPDWRRIDSAWLDGAADLALALDSATNNTSVVLALEFPDDAVLLFVADAQVGNWLSWEPLSWLVKGKRVSANDLLGRAIFYKVGHHGSHNATLKAKGLDLMHKLQIAAIPVNHEMAKIKHWGNMPLPELVAALEKRASKGVIRIDEDPQRPVPGVDVEALYFDISI